VKLKYQLVWFGDEVDTFHISLSRDGAPFGKDNAALAYLVSFLNLRRGVLNSEKISLCLVGIVWSTVFPSHVFKDSCALVI